MREYRKSRTSGVDRSYHIDIDPSTDTRMLQAYAWSFSCENATDWETVSASSPVYVNAVSSENGAIFGSSDNDKLGSMGCPCYCHEQ